MFSTSMQCAVAFAEQRLKRGGRCHESEIMKAFKADNPSFAGQEEYLRDMVCLPSVFSVSETHPGVFLGFDCIRTGYGCRNAT
jgi:hypothetical protein